MATVNEVDRAFDSLMDALGSVIAVAVDPQDLLYKDVHTKIRDARIAWDARVPKLDLPIRYSHHSIPERRRVREQYVELQGGLCCHCKTPLAGPPPEEVTCLPIKWSLFPKGFLNHPVQLHHDHETDLTIGAIHGHCNAYLWQYHGE